jgi:DNA polymerase-3 subunit beta
MKFICGRSALLKEISIANEIIVSKNVISILSNIYLEARDGNLTIKATDMKVNFETKVPVEIQESGSVTVYGDKFFGVLNTAPEGELEFEHKDNYFSVKHGLKKAGSKLKTIASDKYPEFSVGASKLFDIPIREFKDMIQETVFAISDDETRYFMNGVFFEKAEGKFNMVATDGRRLAFINKNATEGVEDFSGIIIPPKILNIVMKHAGDEGMAAISVNDKTIFIQFGSYKLSSVLIEGQFPNYRRVIPETQINHFTVNRLEMLEALRGVSVLVEKSHRVYMGLAPGRLSVYCDENEYGESRREIPCEYDGEELSIALNYRYLEEPFKIMSDERISIHFTDPNKTISMMPVPEKDFFHIVMPMQQE